MGLGKYFSKRKFPNTPEPKSEAAPSTPHKLAFVVQEHHASTLHYDFRLEVDGVLKSWAVPKGPSMDPSQHHLAIQTEDHPYDYRKFEGTIPQGNYGAGNVIIWDEGWYEPRTATDDPQKTLRQELKKGHLTFVVHGKKLHGEFALIKFHGPQAEENAWLLVKKGDEFASHADVTKNDESVISHKKVDDLDGRMPDLSVYPKRAKPWPIKPMLCTLVTEPFSREGWLFEVKWDGFRSIGTKHGSNTQLYSRNAIDFSQKFPPVFEALHDFKHDVIVDGEIVVVDKKGSPHFEWLQNWNRTPEGALHYYIFDILWSDGHDIRTMPLSDRKKLLKHMLPKNDVLRFSDDVPNEGEKLFKLMERRHLEGMVAKQADSSYQEDTRGPYWLKIKTHLRQEVVIGGYTEPRGGRQYLGSLVVGVYDKNKLLYVGHSGGGIPDNQRRELRDKLAKMERQTSPFATPTPKTDTAVHWVQPTLVCEMSFSEWTSEGYMRQPTFEGMRPDKKPTDVHREKPTQKAPDTPVKTGDSPVELTHLDKVFFPKHGYTKGDLIDYYTAVADYMLPYLKDRPCSMLRMPNGINGEGFFQKNNEHLPDWVSHADIFSDSNNANLRWIVGKNLNTLLYMVQLGCVEINPWNSRITHLNNPDWAVIDLDPEGVTFKDVMHVAHTVHQVCDEWGVPAYPKTSGKTGIHIFIPMQAKYSYEQVKNFAHLLVLEVNKRLPDITSVERMPEKRRHKIYLDFLQNREGQTLAAPYSVRPTPDASVSMPLHWDEVTSSLLPENFTIKNALTRLKKVGDLWEPTRERGVDLKKVLDKINETPTV